ncbi:TPA: AAA family ATPase [Bacillus cereus]
MKIRKLKLENFRVYYGNQTIEFSTDEERNLTICLAQNNGGKTTLAQSIIWCLYGYTNLDEPKGLLNKDIEQSMVQGDVRQVSVVLEIVHKGQLYVIKREKSFKKNNNRVITEDSVKTIMTYDSNNVLTDVSTKDINEILPRSLSRFFIFDGERMLHMGSNNVIHKEELEKDIRSILGLDVLEEAISHLGGKNNTGGVLNSLNNKFDSGNDNQITEIKRKINSVNETINKLEIQLNEKEATKMNTESEFLKVSDFLEQNNHIKEKQRERRTLENEIKDLKDRQEKVKKQMLKKFSGSFSYLLLQRLFDKTLTYVADSADLVEAAPDVTFATIDYILEKQECICGTTFKRDDRLFNLLKENKKFYPPESIGTTTKRYIDALRGITKSNDENREEMGQIYGDYLEIDAKIHEKNMQIDTISRVIQASSEDKICQYEEKYQLLHHTIQELNKILTDLQVEKKVKIKEQEELQKDLEQLSNTNEQNKMIIKYKETTREVLNKLKVTYNAEKEKVRKELQQEVQKVYKRINRGKGELNITNKFEFELFTEINGKLIRDNAKGQGLSTVAAFAFVCGITKLVRDKKMNDDLGFSNEPYPLIIDAPYSVMDSGYIEKVSRVLPEYAEQVVILVKDDNYNIAKSIFNKMDVIGKEYEIRLDRNDDGSENQFRTVIE